MINSKSTAPYAKPCGCSGHDSCGCAACSGGGTTTVFSRPNFFAGQLLTDEDLRDAMNYMVQKSRLHNRHFLGEGVVCGLKVEAHPCHDQQHKVIVHGGHAINACGDDILVPHDRELDILEKLRDLMAQKKGKFDCGDPCDEQQNPDGGLKITYGLYVRYTERETGFVTPYQTDHGSSSGCRGSRIEEGYQFELRCIHQPPSYRSLQEAIEHCATLVPDFPAMQGKVLHGISMLEMVKRIVVQYEEIKSKLKEDGALEQLKKDTVDLASEVQEHLKAPAGGGEPPSPEISVKKAAYEVFFKFLTLAYRSAKFGVTFDEGALSAAFEHIEQRLPLLKSKGNAESAELPAALIDQLEIRCSEVRKEFNPATPGNLNSFDEQSYVVGELLEFASVQAMFARLDQVNERIRALASSGRISMPAGLITELRNVVLRAFDNAEYLGDEDRLDEIFRQARIVSRAVSEITRICMCNALLPPCPIENDSAVLLANIVVENCKVSEICNLSRRMVVTGPSLRYWFADFEAIMAYLRRSCCPEKEDIVQAQNREKEALETAITNWKRAIENGVSHPPILVERIEKSEFWKSVHLPDSVGVIEWAAVVPKQHPIDILSSMQKPPSEHSPQNGLDPQELNSVLAALAQRPDTDIRNILDWSKEFESPTDIRAKATKAELQANKAQELASGLDSKITLTDALAKSANNLAGEAKSKATDAHTFASDLDGKITLVDDLAKSANKLADEAKSKAADAHTLATEVDDKAKKADKKADEALHELNKEIIVGKNLSTLVQEQLATAIGGSSTLREFVDRQLAQEIHGKPTLLEFVKSQLAEAIKGEPTLRAFLEKQLAEEMHGSPTLREFVSVQLAETIGGKPTLREFVDRQLAKEIHGKPTLRDFVTSQLAEAIEGEPTLRAFLEKQLTEELHGSPTLRDFVVAQLAEAIGGEPTLRDFVTKVQGQVLIDGKEAKVWLKEQLADSDAWNSIKEKLKSMT